MPCHLKILFIGSNPSSKATSNEAFTSDTASGRLLRTWTQGIEGVFYYENITSQKTRDNRPLNSNEIALATASLVERIKETNPDRIVTLGKAASAVITSLKLEHLEMPHPSGLNRQLNDKEWTTKKIADLRRYCEATTAKGVQAVSDIE